MKSKQNTEQQDKFIVKLSASFFFPWLVRAQAAKKGQIFSHAPLY